VLNQSFNGGLTFLVYRLEEGGLKCCFPFGSAPDRKQVNAVAERPYAAVVVAQFLSPPIPVVPAQQLLAGSPFLHPWPK
jgi:hypothetical protein